MICYRYLRSVGPSILAISLAANDEFQRDARRPSFPISDGDAHLLNIPPAIRIFQGRFTADCRRRILRPDSPPADILHDFPTFAQGSARGMILWMKPSLSEGQGSGLSAVCLFLSLHLAASGVADEPAPATERDPATALRVGAEVVLKMSGTPIYHEGRQISSQDNLTFLAEGVENDRIQVVSRDKTVRGWVFSDQIVALERADEHFNRVVAKDPQDAEAFWIHARLLYYRNDSERALANVNQAIRLEPDQARFYVTRALVQLGRQQADRAIEDCDQAIELDPQSARPYAIRAHAWLCKNEAKRALADLECADQLDSNNPSFHAPKGKPCERADDRPGVGPR